MNTLDTQSTIALKIAPEPGITWEQKVQLISLSNNRHSNDEARYILQKFILEHVKFFDEQAWDMFVHVIDINLEQMKLDIDFWKQMKQYIEVLDTNNDKLGWKTNVRLYMLQVAIKEILP